MMRALKFSCIKRLMNGSRIAVRMGEQVAAAKPSRFRNETAVARKPRNC